ncbi:MAG: ubiquitin-like small modifier protein 1 [Clostridiaceae bacterium]
MKINFFANIRDITKTKNVEIEYCGTLREALLKLSGIYGEKFREKVFKGENLSEEVIILVNGRHNAHLQGIDTILNENDEISIFPVVAGG